MYLILYDWTKKIMCAFYKPLLAVVLLIGAISIGIYKSKFESRFVDKHFNESDPNSEVYDFIVIGSGSAGSIVANRLSKDFSVLLLEAGPTDNHLNVKLPPAFPKLFKSSMDWNYKTIPQKHANNREYYQPRGKVGNINHKK
jgi:hypothetical protein